jgi:arylamine N-acetyltransferase
MEAAQVGAARGLLGPDTTQRYLRLLGVPGRQPGLSAFTALVSAHLMRVPFENISKLHYWKHRGQAWLPSIHQFLDGIEQNNFGGTCYCNNFHFHNLLASLGYQVKLCAADMSTPDVHMVSVVTVEGREYLVDTGYAAPFLEPLPLDLTTDYVVDLGHDRYVLRPKNSDGCSRLELYRDGKLKHGYLVKPQPKFLDDFQDVIADSFRPTATFLNSILLARFWPGHSVVIHNLSLIESQGNQSAIRTLSRDDLAPGIDARFGIPREIVAGAIAGLRELQDAWGEPFLGGRIPAGADR